MDNYKLNNLYREEVQPTQVEDSSVIALKIYGLCRQQDCLKPHDANYDILTDQDSESVKIESAVSRTDGEIKSIGGICLPTAVTYGETIKWGMENCNIKSLKILPGSFLITKVDISEPVPSTYGALDTWDVDIKYYFSYQLQFIDGDDKPLLITVYNISASEPNKEVNSICAESTYNKKRVNLPGGKVNNNAKVVMATTLFSSNSIYKSVYSPYVMVEAEANPLIVPGVIGIYFEGPQQQIISYHADINIGLFTIIKLFRLSNILIQDTLPCIPEPCKNIEPESPCKVFSSIPFPYDDFEPPML